ncbi:MAG: tRNA pseudouridine(13) synthase TruD [Planctomycetaceae bacterium]|nr:tRNA pseudouridine(13) synthase TruD [Planctomycetaceae bacterium]
MILPYLTPDLAGIGGRIRSRIEDFRVDEIPLYAASGEGTHLYFRIEKRGIPTPAAVERLARYMKVKPHDIGLAGLKDAQAVATQWLSLEHADAAKLAAFADANIRVLEVSRHGNKLRPGHLRGNRFAIRIRGAATEAPGAAEAVLDVLQRRGAPNYFGPQRFGARADTALLGRALVAGDLDAFVKLLLGAPADDDPPDCRAARAEFDAGNYDKALSHWPRHYSEQRRALSAFMKKRRPADALRSVDKRMKRLYVSALQSELFNAVLARRIDSLDRLWTGDMAQKTASGAVFYVEDAAAEQPRADAFEISPTGPIVGYRGSMATGSAGEIEQAVLTESGLAGQDFRALGPLKAKGGRRPLRFPLGEPSLSAGTDDAGEFVELRFTAPSGCYATVVLREIMKQDCR